MKIAIKITLMALFSMFVPLFLAGLLLYLLYPDALERLIKAHQFLAIGQRVWLASLLSLAFLFILIIGANFLLAQRIARSLKGLVGATDQVAKGNLSFKITAESKDELAELAHHFNQMTKQARAIKRELEEARTLLEIRVKARTSELEDLTENLEDKVRERTKELQKRVDELERFYQLTIGRELKMIELKRALRKSGQ